MKICFIGTVGAARAVCVGDGADWQHRTRICAAKSRLAHRNIVCHLLKNPLKNWKLSRRPCRILSIAVEQVKLSGAFDVSVLLMTATCFVSVQTTTKPRRFEFLFFIFESVQKRGRMVKQHIESPTGPEPDSLMLHWMFLHTRLCHICKIMFIFVHIMYFFFCLRSSYVVYFWL